MHFTDANSWLATVELFCFALFLLRLSAPDWIKGSSSGKKNENLIINPVWNWTDVYMLLWPTKNRQGFSSGSLPAFTVSPQPVLLLHVGWSHPALLFPLQVMQVVREQIMRALTLKPNSLDQFKSRLQNLSYTEILKIRQSERMNQEDFQSRPILWVNQPVRVVKELHWLSEAIKAFWEVKMARKCWT